MSDPRAFDRPEDALYHNVPLRHVVELPVLGVPVRFESNSAAALALVEESFGLWRSLSDSPGLLSNERVRVRLVVHDGDEGAATPAPVTVRLPDPDRVITMTPGSMAISDGRRREGLAYITPALLADATHVRFHVIEGMTLQLVTLCDRCPVHAGAIARGDVALLLAGPPGTGKSTLAYAAQRRGWRVLTDDAAYVQLRPTFRLWGVPGRVRLLPDSRERFAELASVTAGVTADGTEKLDVVLPDASADLAGALPIASRVGVCLLERGESTPRLAAVPGAEIRAALREGVGLSRARFGAALDDALARLVSADGWRLGLSSDPDAALPLLEEMREVVAARP
jgi:hypothetical protein